jgi:Cu/Ag efflux protein CusF
MPLRGRQSVKLAQGRNNCMVRSIAGSICALALVTAAAAQAEEVVTGTLKHVDARTGVVVLEDGRVIQTTTDTVFLVETPALRLAGVRPGTRVMVIESSAEGNAAAVTDSRAPWALPGYPGETPRAAENPGFQAP